ncbi:hypothetical protein KJ742_04385 [Patescibacteria group bacterium]|nr:hypothetical protein [Patescibacteria group bacterium]MBU1683156.1 hypothetical protein [Patescibacteria group bacterium]MBU1934519.1 hypothetical protein [Patescibacteria group bacterium]
MAKLREINTKEERSVQDIIIDALKEHPEHSKLLLGMLSPNFPKLNILAANASDELKDLEMRGEQLEAVAAIRLGLRSNSEGVGNILIDDELAERMGVLDEAIKIEFIFDIVNAIRGEAARILHFCF